MKKILVIGGTRFFGKKLVEQCIAKGHQVTIITRGHTEQPFKQQVEHIIVDRTDQQALKQAVVNRDFDVVYDNICYSPNEAQQFCEIFNGHIGKLVFTSTMSTYEMDGIEKTEEDFNPYDYPIQFGDTADFSYGEGKRLAEAVLYKEATFPVATVRFPIVMGLDDYTRRLHFHIEHVLQQKPMGFSNMEAEMSFITADEAATFLLFIGLSNLEGPYNATANGTVSLQALIALVEEATGQHAKISLLGDSTSRSPYAISQSWYMSNAKATKAGFEFTQLPQWLPQLIQAMTREIRLHKD